MLINFLAFFNSYFLFEARTEKRGVSLVWLDIAKAIEEANVEITSNRSRGIPVTVKKSRTSW